MDSSCRFCLTALAAAILSAGCSGGGGSDPGDNSTATLSISLMDAPVDDVAEVWVTITDLWIKPRGDGPAIELPLANAPRTVDLLALTDENAAVLLDDAQIPAGSYEWIAMDVDADLDGVTSDSWVMRDDGGMVELRVPSSRVRLVSGFDIAANQAVELLFDWDVRKGLVAPPGQAGYLLKPAFRMLDVAEYGVLRGTVATNTILSAAVPNPCLADDAQDLDAGNRVYVFAGHDATPDDLDGVDDAVATAQVFPSAAGYDYRVLLASPGQYTVAFTCQGALDDPEADDALVFFPPANGASANVTIAGDTVTVDF